MAWNVWNLTEERWENLSSYPSKTKPNHS